MRIVGGICSVFGSILMMIGALAISEGAPGGIIFTLTGLPILLVGVWLVRHKSETITPVSYRQRVASGEMKVCPSCGNLVLTTINICPQCSQDVSRVVPNVRDFDKRIEKKQETVAARPLTMKDYVIAWGVMLFLLFLMFIFIAFNR